MGGGLPAAAFGGRADVMARLAPQGPVYQAGTLSGNPLAVAAGRATLEHCTPEVYAHVDATAEAVGRLASEALTSAGRRAPGQPRRQPVQHLLRRPRGRRLRDRRRSRTSCGTRPSSTRCCPRRLPAAERVRVVVRQRRPRRARRSSGSPRRCRTPPGAAAAGRTPPSSIAPPDRGGPSMTRTTVHLLRHGEVHNPEACSTAGCPASGCPTTGCRWPATPPRRCAAATSRPSSPRRCSARRRRPGRSPRCSACRSASTSGSSRAATTSRARRSASATAPSAGPQHWPQLRNPFTPSWGEPYVEIAQRMLAAARERARRRARPRGGLRQPPAADLDRAPLRRGPQALAPPGPPAVRPRLAHQHHVGGRPDRHRHLQRAGRRRLPPPRRRRLAGRSRRPPTPATIFVLWGGHSRVAAPRDEDRRRGGERPGRVGVRPAGWRARQGWGVRRAASITAACAGRQPPRTAAILDGCPGRRCSRLLWSACSRSPAAAAARPLPTAPAPPSSRPSTRARTG